MSLTMSVTMLAGNTGRAEKFGVVMCSSSADLFTVQLGRLSLAVATFFCCYTREGGRMFTSPCASGELHLFMCRCVACVCVCMCVCR